MNWDWIGEYLKKAGPALRGKQVAIHKEQGIVAVAEDPKELIRQLEEKGLLGKTAVLRIPDGRVRVSFTYCKRCGAHHGDSELSKTACQIRFLMSDCTLNPALDALLERAADEIEEFEQDQMVAREERQREQAYEMQPPVKR